MLLPQSYILVFLAFPLSQCTVFIRWLGLNSRYAFLVRYDSISNDFLRAGLSLLVLLVVS